MLVNTLAISKNLVNNAAFQRVVLKSIPLLPELTMALVEEIHLRKLSFLFTRLQKAKKDVNSLIEELNQIRYEIEKTENGNIFKPHLPYLRRSLQDDSKPSTSKDTTDTTNFQVGTIDDVPSAKKRKCDLPQENGYVVAYTDGACENNGTENAKAGIGVWFGPNHPLNVSKPVTGKATNNVAEIQACISAVKIARENGFKKLKIITDSQFVINSMTKWIAGWKRKGWKLANGKSDVKNKIDFQKLDTVTQGMDIQWEHVPGHKGIAGNENADKLAREGAKLYKTDK